MFVISFKIKSILKSFYYPSFKFDTPNVIALFLASISKQKFSLFPKVFSSFIFYSVRSKTSYKNLVCTEPRRQFQLVYHGPSAEMRLSQGLSWPSGKELFLNPISDCLNLSTYLSKKSRPFSDTSQIETVKMPL